MQCLYDRCIYSYGNLHKFKNFQLIRGKVVMRELESNSYTKPRPLPKGAGILLRATTILRDTVNSHKQYIANNGSGWSVKVLHWRQ